MNIQLCHGGDGFLDGRKEILCPNHKWCLCFNMVKYQELIRDAEVSLTHDVDKDERNPYGGGHITMGPGSIDMCFPNCEQFVPIHVPYKSMIATMKKWKIKKKKR